MASCVLGCVVAMATVTWWPRYFCLIPRWNYGCSTLLPGCPDNIIIANEAGERSLRRRRRGGRGVQVEDRRVIFYTFISTCIYCRMEEWFLFLNSGDARPVLQPLFLFIINLNLYPAVNYIELLLAMTFGHQPPMSIHLFLINLDWPLITGLVGTKMDIMETNIFLYHSLCWSEIFKIANVIFFKTLVLYCVHVFICSDIITLNVQVASANGEEY